MQSIKFQEDNVKALVSMFALNNRILLADETGLGKTLTTVLLIAGLNCQKKQKLPDDRFKVLYICSNERIARKNMRELCEELSDEQTIQNAARLTASSLSMTKEDALKWAISPKEAQQMAGRRNARLSLELEDYCESNILIYNATPETSFRVSTSIAVGGTEEEFYKLMSVKKTDKVKDFLNTDNNASKLKETNFELYQYLIAHENNRIEELLGYKDTEKKILAPLAGEFARRRKNAVTNNFKKEKFDLIVLDEYQSYEDILPVDGITGNANGAEGTTISDLLAESDSTKVLMLSATPYQSRTDKPNKFEDFRGILAFMSGGNDKSELVKKFDIYNNALLNNECSFGDLINSKDEFEKEFQKYCRRNQRSDAFGETKKKALFSNPIIKTQTQFLDALREEGRTRKETWEIRMNHSDSTEKSTEEEDSGILGIQMERDTAWGYSFSKDYKYRKNKNSKELYNKIAGYENLLITTGEKLKEDLDSKRCDQSMIETGKESEKGEVNSASVRLDCRRLFEPGHPKELCEAPKWPNFKVQAVREVAIESEEGDKNHAALYNCIWLPPSSPDYEPDKDSPYYKFYKKNPSKTLVFSHYKMTTRSIAALLSIEAAKCEGNGTIGFDEMEWEYFCKVPGETDIVERELREKGHPFLCAYNALEGHIKEESVRCLYAQKTAKELVNYFRKPEIQVVLKRVGINSCTDLLRYCRNGNLTAVLREYFSTKRIDVSKKNPAIQYVISKCPQWDRLTPSERLKKVYRLAWNEMLEAEPDKIVEDILENGFKDEYIDEKREPYSGNGKNSENGEADGFEKARIAAWKTWFAYQLIYGKRSSEIKEKLKAAVEKAIERRLREPILRRTKGKTVEVTKFGNRWCIAYPDYKVGQISNGQITAIKESIAAHSKASYIMKTEYADWLTFAGTYKAPWRYIVQWAVNNEAENEVNNVNDFFMKGVEYRLNQKEKDVRKTQLYDGYVGFHKENQPLRALNTYMFDGFTEDIWYDVDEKNNDNMLGMMPEMHVCVDFKGPTGVQCGRIPLGFASRYTNEIQDSNDHNDNGAEEVLNAFNSPFYPFVLVVTDTAKEGLNFHSYCRKIIHLNIPNRPAVLIQREGRVDRYRSLVLRQRLAMKNAEPINNWEASWKNESNISNGMVPCWYIDMDDGPKIEKYYLINSGTDDAINMGNIERDSELFKRTLGSFLEDDLVKTLKHRYPNEDIGRLRLNLIP